MSDAGSEVKILGPEVEVTSSLTTHDAAAEDWKEFEGAPVCLVIVAIGFMLMACFLYFLSRRKDLK